MADRLLDPQQPFPVQGIAATRRLFDGQCLVIVDGELNLLTDPLPNRVDCGNVLLERLVAEP